jgi:GNAT superfamily N-acetyltransferase
MTWTTSSSDRPCLRIFQKQVLGMSMLVTDPAGASFVAVAVKGIEVIGMATAQTLVSTAEGGRVGLVEDVIVRKDWRGKGTGTRLLDAVVDWSRGMKLKRLQLLADLDNRLALDFYRTRGWQATSLIALRRLL